jgi:UPF0176 protein
VRPQKIILYYGFTPLEDPDAIRLWQRTLCESLSLTGRILISRHGINGTLGGDLDDLRRYIAATKEYPGTSLRVTTKRASDAASPRASFTTARIWPVAS